MSHSVIHSSAEAAFRSMIVAHWEAPLLDNDIVVACAKAAVLSGRPVYIFNPTTREIRRGDVCRKVKPGAARLLTKLLIADRSWVPMGEVMDLCAPLAGKGAAASLIGGLRKILEPLGIKVSVSNGRGYWLSGPIQLCHPSELVDTWEVAR